MANLILAVIGIVFAMALMAGGIGYFSPTLMAEFRIADRITSGFRLLSAGYSAYVIANKQPVPYDPGFPNDWQDHLIGAGYAYWPRLPELNDDIPSNWTYVRRTAPEAPDQQPAFCLMVTPSGSDQVSNVAYRAMQSAAKRYAASLDTINTRIAASGSPITVDDCDDIMNNLAALQTAAENHCGPNVTVQDCFIGTSRIGLRFGTCNAKNVVKGDQAVEIDHPICWDTSPPAGTFGLSWRLD